LAGPEAVAGIRVGDVMAREYPAVDKDETLEHAVRVMRKHDSDRVVVFEEGRLVGIMTKKDIMMKLATLRTRNLVPGRMHVSSFMSPSPETIAPAASIVEAAHIMVEKNIGSLPVVDGGEVIGLVTRWEVAGAAKLLEARVAEAMINAPQALKPTNKLLHARQLILKYDLLFLPVVDEGGRVVGYVTVDEVADAFLAFHEIVPEKFRKEKIEQLVVDEVMRLRPPSASADDPLKTLVERMEAKRAKGGVVLHEGRLAGIVTLNELVKLVAALG